MTESAASQNPPQGVPESFGQDGARRARMRRRAVRPILVDGEIATVTLTKGYVAVIDVGDVELIRDWNWFAQTTPSGHVYATRSTWRDQRRVMVQMHRVFVNPPPGMFADHIDGDCLNNRRSNLRACTPQQNSVNHRVSARNALGVNGVYRRGDRFKASIYLQGREVCLGYFDTIAEARDAQLTAAHALRGEFVRAAP